MRSALRELGSGEEARPGGAATGKRARCGVCRGLCAGAVRRPFGTSKARGRPGETIPRGYPGAIRVSSHAARSTRTRSSGAVGCGRATAAGGSIRLRGAWHGILRQVRRGISRLCARRGVPCSRTRPRGCGGVSKGPQSPRRRISRSYRRPGVRAPRESVRFIGRQR